MGISKPLAQINAERFASFSTEVTSENSKQALLTFKGDVYRGMQIDEFSDDDLNYAQDHLRILSGLYGLLRPLDRIQAYRLEMGTKIKLGRKNNLYQYWGNKITDRLNEDIEAGDHSVVLNLASKEYYGALQTEDIKAKVVHVHFKEYRNGELKFLSFNAKKARGMMASYIIKNKINQIEKVIEFDTEEYAFDPSLSSEFDLTFTR